MGFIISSLIVFMVVLNLKLHHSEEQGNEVPEWLQKFTRTVLVRISCWRDNKVDTWQETQSDQICSKNAPISYVTMENHAEKTDSDGRTSQMAWKTPNTDEFSFRDIAMMLDKICFVAFFCLTVLVTAIFMLILAVGGD